MYNRIRSQIDELVQTDPTAFYSYEEYETAAQMLYDTVKLRAESIAGQLDGSIPSTDDGQRADSSALIDASQIDVKVMGQFSMGGFGGRSSDDADTGSEPASESRASSGDPAAEGRPDSESAPASEEQTSEAASADIPSAGVHRQRPSFSGMPEPSADTGKTEKQNLILFGICLVILLAALIAAKRFKRK